MPSVKTNLAEEIARLEAELEGNSALPDFHRLADAYTRAGRFADAVRVCRHGLKHHPRSARGLVAHGRALFGLGSLAEATETLKRALSIDSGEAEPYRLLGEVLLRRARHADAIQLLERAVGDGVADPKVAALLQRVRHALEQEATQVSAAPSVEPRGIGNRAVAGSIGPRGVVGDCDEAEVTRRVSSPDPAPLVMARGDDSKTNSLVLPRPSRRGEGARSTSGAADSSDDRPSAPGADERSAVASPRGSAAEPVQAADWSSIGNRWEAQLDAGFGDGPQGDSDLRGPIVRTRTSESLKFGRLVDPLAEGMPPLPPDSGTQEVDLAASGQLPSMAAEDAETPPPQRSWPCVEHYGHAQDHETGETDEADEAGEADEEITHEGRPGSPRAGDAMPVGPDDAATAETLPPFPMPEVVISTADLGLAQHGAALEQLPRAPGRPQQVTPESITPVLRGSRATSPESGDVDGGDGFDGFEGFEGLDGSEGFEGLDLGDEEVPAARARGRRRGGWPWILVLLGVIGAGGFFGWRHLEGRRLSRTVIAQARQARAEGSAPALAEARRELRAHPGGQQLRAEAELLSALQWLVHREGDGQAAGDPASKCWAGVAARAAMAIADNRLEQARRLLDGFEPGDDADRALRNLLLGWAAWLAGQREVCERKVSRALAHEPRLALAWLLRGHVLREAGELGAARAAYDRARSLSPRDDLARFGLAATLMAAGSLALESDAVSSGDRESPVAASGDAVAGSTDAGSIAVAGSVLDMGPTGAESGELVAASAFGVDEVRALLARPATSPVGKAWARILAAELELKRGGRLDGSRAVSETVASLPASPDLLYHAIEVQRLACDFDGARNSWGRLKQARSDDSTAVRSLEGQLALSEGRDALAARLLDGVDEPRAVRLRALALLLTGDASAARQVLGGDDRRGSPDVLHSLAEALRQPASSLEPLRARARRSAVGQLALVVVLLQRGAWTEAERAGRQLAAHPWLRGRALTHVAEAQGRRGDGAGALETLRRVGVVCPGFLPAQQALGVRLVEAGHHEEGVGLLSAVQEKGLVPVDLLVALARGYAELGQKNRALVTLRELSRTTGETLPVKLAEGYVQLAQGAHRRALAAFRQAGDGFAAVVGAGRALGALGQLAPAQERLLRAIERDPHHPLPQLLLGEILHRRGQKARALSHLQRAIALAGGGQIYARWILARAHIEIARAGGDGRRSALEHLQAAIKAEPSSALGYRLLGEQHLTARRARAARLALTRSVQIDPDDASAWYSLGVATAERGAARRAFERFLQLEQSGRRAQDARRRLSRLR